MQLIPQKLLLSLLLLLLHIYKTCALPASLTQLPPTNPPHPTLQDHLHPQHPPAPAAQPPTLTPPTHPNTTTILTDRIPINPTLIIIIDLSYPLPNTTAIFALFTHSRTYAHSRITHHGPNATLPRRITRTEDDLRYFVQPPNVQAFNRFTWEDYKEVTEWLFFYLYFERFNFACAFNVRRRVEGGGEVQIGYGEVGMMVGGVDGSRWVSPELLEFNASAAVSR